MITRLTSQFKDAPTYITVLEVVKHFLWHKFQPTRPSKKGRTCHSAQRTPSFPIRFGRKSPTFHGNRIIFFLHKGRKKHNKGGRTFFTEKDRLFHSPDSLTGLSHRRDGGRTTAFFLFILQVHTGRLMLRRSSDSENSRDYRNNKNMYCSLMVFKILKTIEGYPWSWFKSLSSYSLLLLLLF